MIGNAVVERVMHFSEGKGGAVLERQRRSIIQPRVGRFGPTPGNAAKIPYAESVAYPEAHDTL
jgi:hypothetical protein